MLAQLSLTYTLPSVEITDDLINNRKGHSLGLWQKLTTQKLTCPVQEHD